MTKGQRKDLLREITRNKSRFLSILFIVVLGVAFLSGIRASEPDMLITVDDYYDKYDFMDIRVISTLGLTDSDVLSISKVKGVSYVCGGKYTETYAHFIDNTGEEPRLETKTLKVYEYISGINEPYILEGNIPTKEGECFIDSRLARYYDIELGEEITLISGSSEALSDTLSCDTYKVTGIGRSPWYLTHERGTGSIGTGTIDFFIMIDGQNFVTDYYTEIYVQAEGAQALVSGTDAYDSVVDRVVDRIKLLESEGLLRRREELIESALSEAMSGEDYRKEYEKAYDEALEKVRQEAYDEAYETAYNTAYEEAYRTAYSAAYEEALKTVKEEALSQALDTARQEALETAIKTARDTAYEEALTTAKEEGLKIAMQKAQETAYPIALAKAKETAYSEGYAQINGYVSQITGQVVDAFARLSNDEMEEVIEIMNDPATTINDQLKKAQRVFDKIGVKLPDSVDISALVQNRIYILVIDALTEYIRDNEFSAQDSEKIKADIISRITPTVNKLYDEYFNSQFDTLYKTLFDIQFPKEFEKQYGDTVKEEFEKTFAAEYQAQFDEEFEKGFNENLDLIEEKFNETFDTQYKPLIELSFEKTFNEEYLDEFDEEFDKNFLEEGKPKFDEEFEKRFQEEGKPKFDEEFEKNFNENIATFDEEFTKEFDEEFKKEATKTIREKVPDGKWYVYNRCDSVPTYVEYLSDAEGIGKIGKVFPIIFFLVAALVALTTMTRMVDDERLLIGSLKAMGYSNISIAGKYIVYTLLASVTGSVIGFLAGEKMFPLIIMNAYGILFSEVPWYLAPYQWDIALLSTFAAVGCILAATLFACVKATNSRPASLMRPPAPKAGSRIFLEYLTFIWKRLSFTAKASMRNLFRYKKRLFMTIFGIAGCMGLMMVGYGIRDSIMTITSCQYKELFVYDVSVTIGVDAAREDKEELIEDIKGYEGVTDLLLLSSQTIDFVNGDYTRSMNLFAPQTTENITDYMHLRDRQSGVEYDFPKEGVAISEKAANQLGVKAGDYVGIMVNDEEVKVLVSYVFENYVYHMAFVSPDTYAQIFSEDPDYDTIYIREESRDEEFQNQLSTYIMGHSGASGVIFISNLNGTLLTMLTSLNGVIWVLIIAAGLLAFVVLYNLNNISISERRRELATIKVLGFYHGEVAAYIYRDNIWLTLFGCFAGIFFGKWLHSFIIDTVEVDMMMFGRNISLYSYFICMAFTILFSVMVNIIMYFQLKKIDMVESLKSVE